MKNARLKFKTILALADLSYQGSLALRYAQAMVRLYHGDLLVMHVVDPISYEFPHGEASVHAVGQTAHEEFERIEEKARLSVIPIHSEVETETICQYILQVVKDNHADLLIVESRGKTEVGRRALGLIARRLLAKTPCPIMTVSPDAETSLPWAGCWRRVLAATDLSPASIAALHCAHQVSLRQLITLHVSGCKSEGQFASPWEKLLRLVSPLRGLYNVPIECLVVSGDAGEVIAEHARKFATDLVVLGAPANELAEEDLETSTVLNVISNVTCPVLCVPSVQGPSPNRAKEVAFA